MKLMLTSAGISNKSIERELRRLAGKKIRFAFIPTAANLTEGPKHWLINSYVNLMKLGSVDIVDISALPKKIWLKRLKEANVIVVGGGSPVYLMKWINKSGLKKELPKLLKTRVYVGLSAGSVVLSKRFSKILEAFYDESVKGAPRSLGYVDFEFMPHLNAAFMPKVRDKNIRKVKNTEDIYAIDDNSAIVWVDGKVKVVSEGSWKKY